MKKVIMICDKCGKEYPNDYKARGYHPYKVMSVAPEGDESTDLCPECLNDLESWMRGGKAFE